MEPQRMGKVGSSFNTVGLSGQTTHREGSVVHQHHGSVWAHDIRQRFVRSQNTMGLCGPMTYGKGSFVHRTPWVCVGPWHTAKVRSFTEHHGSVWTHDIWKRFVRSQNTMGLCGPMTYGKGSFVHRTPWVCVDPWHTEKVRSFTEHHGSLWTHDVRKRFVHKTPWVPRDPWRMGSKYFQRIRCARSEM